MGVSATTYTGRVVDESGQPISYATVYPERQPELGTATNNDGYFSFEAALNAEDPVIISFIGFAKQTVKSEELRVKSEKDAALQAIVLKEHDLSRRNDIPNLLSAQYALDIPD